MSSVLSTGAIVAMSFSFLIGMVLISVVILMAIKKNVRNRTQKGLGKSVALIVDNRNGCCYKLNIFLGEKNKKKGSQRREKHSIRVSANSAYQDHSVDHLTSKNDSSERELTEENLTTKEYLQEMIPRQDDKNQEPYYY